MFTEFVAALRDLITSIERMATVVNEIGREVDSLSRRISLHLQNRVIINIKMIVPANFTYRYTTRSLRTMKAEIEKIVIDVEGGDVTLYIVKRDGKRRYLFRRGMPTLQFLLDTALHPENLRDLTETIRRAINEYRIDELRELHTKLQRMRRCMEQMCPRE